MNGPWKWSESGLQLLDNTGRTVLRIQPSDATQEEFDAIVAAPDLLAACKAMLETIPYMTQGQRGAYAIIENAIAKAEGSV